MALRSAPRRRPAADTAASAFRFDVYGDGSRIAWQPYAGLPTIVSCANAVYTHQPDWHRNFLYAEEQARGLDCNEDLATPGVPRWDLARGPAV